MSTTYEWEEDCPNCKANLEVSYNDSSGSAFMEVTCDECKTTFDIIMEFVLREKRRARKTK